MGQLRKSNISPESVGSECSQLPADASAAAELIAQNTKLPRLKDGVAESTAEAKDLQQQAPSEWADFQKDLGTRVIQKGDLAVDVSWCIPNDRCFKTKAVIDSAGRIKFEPVLSMNVWDAKVEVVQPKQVRRHIRFLDGFGQTIAEYFADLTFKGDGCTITAGTPALDVVVVSLNSAIFDERRTKDEPTIYKGTSDCGQPVTKRDWVRARVSLELATRVNPGIPTTPLTIGGTTRQATIRFDVSASGEDNSQVPN